MRGIGYALLGLVAIITSPLWILLALLAWGCECMYALGYMVVHGHDPPPPHVRAWYREDRNRATSEKET